MSEQEKTKVNRISFNNFSYAIVFIVSAICIEIGTFIALGFNFLPTYFMLDFFVMLLVASLIFFMSNKIAQMVFIIIVLIIQCLISYVNLTLFNIYGDLFSFDMLVLGGEALAAFDSSFLNIGFLCFLFVVLIVAITLMSLFLKHKIKFKFKSKTAIIVLAIFLLSQGVGIGGYFTQLACLKQNNDTEYSKYFENDKTLYNKLFLKKESLKKFGTYSFYLKNLFDLTFESKEYKNHDKIKNYITTNPEYESNSKTGVLSDDNLIVIMCESLEWYAVNPITTPTLNKLFNEGVNLTNYISKSKTNYSEMDVILGSTPTDNSFTNSWRGSNSSLLGNKLSFSLPNKLKNSGFDTAKFFHNNDGNFYGRETTHPTFGFDEVITLEDMNIDDKADGVMGFDSSYTKDSDMIESCINSIAPLNERFFSFITTVVTHGPYEQSSKLTEYYELLDDGLFDEYKNWLNEKTDYKLPTDAKILNNLYYYTATTMDLDRAVEFLIDYLTQNSLLNSTTLVLYSDHNAYYQNLSYNMRGLLKTDYENTELYRVPATIYSTKLETEKIDKFVCPYNLAPTILDLLGIPFNNKLYMGYSIYNENYKKSVFVSQLGGMMTDLIYSDNNKDLKSDVELTEEEKLNFKENVLQFFIKQDYMNLIYNSNIFEKYPELINYV